MITKAEIKELLYILNFYLLSGVSFGVVSETVAVYGGVQLVHSDYGLPFSPKALTVLIVILIGVMTGLLAYLVLLPAEIKLIRRTNKPKLLAQRLSRRIRNDLKRK